MNISENHRFELDTRMLPLSQELMLEQIRIHIRQGDINANFVYIYVKSLPGILNVFIPDWMVIE